MFVVYILNVHSMTQPELWVVSVSLLHIAMVWQEGIHTRIHVPCLLNYNNVCTSL